MESYKCKFCFKSFVNGRALGSHMRSHKPTLHKFSIGEDVEEEEISSQLSDDTESNVSSSSSEEGEEGKKNGLREEKHRTMDDDPKFAFIGSGLLVDDESETESSRNIINLTRKRSKRTRKLDSFATKKTKTSQLGYKTVPEPEPECEPPHSSASDTTTDEDLAFCLMMLSRDKWKKNKTCSKEVVEEIDTEDSEGYNKSSKIINRATTTKGRYSCETCGKVFKSYQALGGHRASHKKNRASNKTEQRSETENDNVVVAVEKRIHECPICLKVFASGQVLGGHKRSHGIGNLSVNHHHHHHQVRLIESVKQSMIDLNLPAPTEEDEVSVTTNVADYSVSPKTGVILPRSTCEVLVQRQVSGQGVIASHGVTAHEITREMFSKEAGHQVENTTLSVTYVYSNTTTINCSSRIKRRFFTKGFIKKFLNTSSDNSCFRVGDACHKLGKVAEASFGETLKTEMSSVRSRIEQSFETTTQ